MLKLRCTLNIRLSTQVNQPWLTPTIILHNGNPILDIFVQRIATAYRITVIYINILHVTYRNTVIYIKSSSTSYTLHIALMWLTCTLHKHLTGHVTYYIYSYRYRRLRHWPCRVETGTRKTKYDFVGFKTVTTITGKRLCKWCRSDQFCTSTERRIINLRCFCLAVFA